MTSSADILLHYKYFSTTALKVTLEPFIVI